MLRTKEQLELLFQQRREINKRKRERELKKQKERQERLKKFREERLPTIFKKTQRCKINSQKSNPFKCITLTKWKDTQQRKIYILCMNSKILKNSIQTNTAV